RPRRRRRGRRQSHDRRQSGRLRRHYFDRAGAAMNRTQALLIGFVIFSWVALVAILVGAPEMYDAQLRPLGLAGLPYARLAFLATITGLLVLLAIGTLRRWRWMFWLLLVAFAAGILRVPL